MKTIILTGFEAFNGRSINPSSMIVEKIREPENVRLIKYILPVEFKKTTVLLKNIVETESPDIILSIGQAGNVPHISVERVAINMDNCMSSDGRNVLPDSSGDAAIDRKIFEDGENAYFATIPVNDIVKKVNEAGVACRMSYSAGTYVCNHVMYVGAYLANKSSDKTMMSGFIHVPFLPEQLEGEKNTIGRYSMKFDDMLKGVQVIVDNLSYYTPTV